MKYKWYSVYCFTGLFSIYPYIGSDVKWNKRRKLVKNEVFDLVKLANRGFIKYTRELYCYSWNSQVMKRWEEILYDVLVTAYRSNHEWLENMMEGFEKSDFCVQRELLFPKIFKKMLHNLLDNDELSLEKLVNLCKQEKYYNIKRKFIRYSIEVFMKYSECSAKRLAFLKKCQLFFETESNCLNKIALMHLIGCGKCMDKDLFQMYCKMIYNVKDKKICYYYGVCETAWLTFLYPNIIYPNYYMDRKEFLKNMAFELQEIFYKKKRNDFSKKRIAVLVSGLYEKNAASLRLEVNLANTLHKKGYEVKIFTSELNNILHDFDGYLNPTGIKKEYSSINFPYIKDLIYEDIDVYYNIGNDYKELFNNYLHAVYEYDPSLIVDISWEHSIFSHLLIENFPIVMVPLGGNSSSAAYDKIIVRNLKAVHEMNQDCFSIDVDKAVEGNIYIPYQLNTINEKFRKKLKVKKNEYILVTVGNRLDAEIDKEFAINMVSLLRKYSNIRWIVVGIWKGTYDEFDEFIINKQIVRTGIVKNLPDLYRACDLYVNPLRVGGGGSIAMFIQGGKPAVVSNIASDILPFIGEENCVGEGTVGIFNFVERLYLNRSIGDQLAEKQRDNLLRNEFSADFYADILLKEFEKIVK